MIDGNRVGWRGARIEISTVGFDQDLQMVGSDPYGSPYWVGQRIPTTVLPNNGRYLYICSFARFGANRKARLVGARQMVVIGQYIATSSGDNTVNYPLLRQVTTPFWRFPDANISWHLRRVPPGQQMIYNTSNAEGLQFRYGTMSTLLYEVASPYTAPYGGLPPGVPLVPDLGTFHDIRFPWQNGDFDSLDVEIQGPCDIVLFASVKQTNPNTRTPLVLPSGVPLDVLGPEDGFIASLESAAGGFAQQRGPAPNAVYWSVAGSLIFEEENFYRTPLEKMQSEEEESPVGINR